MGTNISPETADNTRPALALIAGPTASGKSGLAVRYAQFLQSRGQRVVIINADSAQVYSDLAILSARPSEGEMGGDVASVLNGATIQMLRNTDGAWQCEITLPAAAANTGLDVNNCTMKAP